MNAYVERTCTEGRKDNARLSGYRGTDAYALLGGPGSGKTRAFKEEAQQTAGGLYVPAHDFVELTPRDEWRDSVLFIDGLDELRARSPSPEPLGQIRTRLDELGKPRFRLSCRDADWYGMDGKDLAKVSRSGSITELKLNPLSDGEIRELLAALNVNEACPFADGADEDGTVPLPRDPLSLEHLVRAVEDGQRPRSRKEAFEASCRSLLRECNLRHTRRRENVSFGVDARLDAAAHLCAVALLAGKRGYVDGGTDPGTHWIAIEDVPGSRDLYNSVLRTRLFASNVGPFSPSHHHVAEFLAGRHLANRVASGLPISRAIALMAGFDGRVVAALRGVWAWFAAHCPEARAELIAGDPIGTVLYGDVKEFSVADKRRLLDGARCRSGELRDLPSHGWSSPRWADVATEGAADLIREVFSKAADSEQGQWLALLLVEALERRTLSSLYPLLLSVIRGERLLDGTRRVALRKLIRQFEDAPTLEDDLCRLLGDIAAGELTDQEDELTGHLLSVLYPHRVSLAAARRLLHAPKNPILLGQYRHFWTSVVQEKAVPSEREEAMQLAMEFERLAAEAAGDAPKAGILP